MQDSLTVRQSARDVGVYRNTRFRWRHRFLAWSKNDRPEHLHGITEADETDFLESSKGARPLDRPARKWGCRGNGDIAFSLFPSHAVIPLPELALTVDGLLAHRVAISNERIVGIDGDHVVWRVRAGVGCGKKRTLRLPGIAFIDRFLLHVLPAGFKRIRHYGLLAPARKRSGLAAARAALDVPPPSPATLESVTDFLRRVARIESTRCPCCASGQMQVVAALPPVRRNLLPRGPP